MCMGCPELMKFLDPWQIWNGGAIFPVISGIFGQLEIWKHGNGN